MTQELPDCPSGLIRLALKDLEACECDPQYRIVMEYWHLPTQTGCCVCLAGAVMAQTLKTPLTQMVNPRCFYDSKLESGTELKLLALDSLRAGNIKAGLAVMGFEAAPSMPRTWPVPYYGDWPLGFKVEMLKIASMLEQAGL
jgi:hypothetical protein